MSDETTTHDDIQDVAHDEHAGEHGEDTHAETSHDSENPVTAVAGQFGLDGQIFLAQAINFLIVLVILWKFVYKPVVRMLDERTEKIEKSVKQANEIEERVAKIESEKDDILNAARKEAQTIAEEAHAAANKRRDEMIDSAKREVERVIAQGKDQLAKEKTAMMRDLRKDIVDVTVKAVARILDDQVDEKKSQSIAEEVVRKMT